MEKKQFKLLLLLLVVGFAVACAGAEMPADFTEPPIAAEDTGSIDGVEIVEATRVVTVEVVKEVEVEESVELELEVESLEEAMEEEDPFGDQQAEYSSGQEITSRATPQPPREKGVTVEPSAAEPLAAVEPTAVVAVSAEFTTPAEVRVEDSATEAPLAVVASPIAAVSEPTAIPQPTATWPPAATAPIATSAPAPTAVPVIATNPAVTPVSPRPEPSPTAVIEAEPVERLAAGVVDDNDAFDAYLDYLKRWNGPEVIPVDVSIRQRFVVLDSAEKPIHGAQIDIYRSPEDVQPLATLRTHADGSALLFPTVFGVGSEQAWFAVYDDGDTRPTYKFQPFGNRTMHTLVRTTEHESPLKLDILLLLDATGSMGDEIQQLKDNISHIAQRTIESSANPFLRFALVSYRDRGDEYLTYGVDFSTEYEQFEQHLRNVKALGGGDYPEDLNQGLFEAVHEMSWDGDAIQLIFLVADAPPHLDYGQNDHYIASAFAANERGIKIYPIASSGLDQQGEYIFRQLAQLTDSNFIFLVDDAEGDAQSGDDVETEFAVSDFTVGALDDIVIEIIESELSHQTP